MSALDVTAIVPTYNRAGYLDECLDGLLRQTRRPRQIIVIDDGSDDATAAVAARKAAAGVAYLRQPNAGKAAALNRALRHAVGDSIWIFDDDDVAAPGALARLWEALAGAPEAGFAFGRHDVFTIGADGRRRITTPEPAEIVADDLYWSCLQRCFAFQPAMLVRRRCYDALGPFDETLPRAQDYDMLLRLTRRFRGVHVPAVLFHQRFHHGTRGPATLRIPGTEVWNRQVEFDAMVIGKAHRAAALEDYLPASARTDPLPRPQRLRALFRRSALAARWRMWEAAARDLSEAESVARACDLSSLPAEAAALYGRILERRDTAAELRDGNPLLRQAAAIADRRLRAEVLAALFWPVVREGLRSLAARDLGWARQQAALYLALTRGQALPIHLWRLARRSLRLPARTLRPC